MNRIVDGHTLCDVCLDAMPWLRLCIDTNAKPEIFCDLCHTLCRKTWDAQIGIVWWS